MVMLLLVEKIQLCINLFDFLSLNVSPEHKKESFIQASLIDSFTFGCMLPYARAHS